MKPLTPTEQSERGLCRRGNLDDQNFSNVCVSVTRKVTPPCSGCKKERAAGQSTWFTTVSANLASYLFQKERAHACFASFTAHNSDPMRSERCKTRSEEHTSELQ